MDVKKSKSVDLERFKTLFFQLGLVVSIAAVIFAFEWSSSGSVKPVFDQSNSAVDVEEMTPLIENVETPPPPAIEIPPLSDELIIVSDDISITSSVLFTPEYGENVRTPEKVYTPIQLKTEEEIVEDFPPDVIQEPPMFMGGDANDFSRWVNRNIVYPKDAQDNGISGKVILQFRVGVDGRVGNVKVLRGVDPALDKEAVRVVMSSPAWTPGRNNDRKVNVIYTFPVNFQLQY